MAWITPKTDWVSSDYFNIEDYSRIRGNIQYVYEYALQLYKFFGINAMQERTLGGAVAAELLNDVENNLDKIVENTYNLIEYRPGKSFEPGQAAWNYDDLNRIERNLLLIITMLESQEAGLKRLAFELGGVQFG